jgi:hypothetical protein
VTADELDVGREELREQVDALWPAEAPGEAFGVYGFDAGDPRSELARQVERAVFEETFGNSPELLAQEYGPYEDATYFFCVVDHRRRLPVGAVRLILPSVAGSKTLHDVERRWGCGPAAALARAGLELDPGRVWDIATIAVDRDYRRRATQGLVSGALYQALCRNAALAGVGLTVAVLDLVVLEMIQVISHEAYHPFDGCEPMRYLDSPASVPVYCDVPRYLPRLAETDPGTYELLIEGKGLETAVRPPDWDRMQATLVGATSAPDRRAP